MIAKPIRQLDGGITSRASPVCRESQTLIRMAHLAAIPSMSEATRMLDMILRRSRGRGIAIERIDRSSARSLSE
jgi:hypothetical protein